MKAIFVVYFNISVGCCALMLFAMLVRLALKRAPKAFVCLLWALVFVRLALPIGLEFDWSLRPSLPIITEESTGLFFESELIPEEQIPSYIPRARASFSFEEWTVRVDYVMIAAWVWALGVGAILLYTAISYMIMRQKLRNAVHLKDNIYMTDAHKGGFLLGYIQPRIYLSETMDDQTAETVIAHEKAHQSRGDNWLKLFAFIVLGVHWYNPFTWIAYLMLCKDIEYACDEKVIKGMHLEDRKQYSTALLSVGRERSGLRNVMLPFGEGMLRRRIVTVLNYRKPALWICIIAIVVIVFSAVFLVTDPMPEHPPYYRQLMRLVGQPKETVVEQLETELVENEDSALSGYYNTPIRVEYKGVEFDLVLGFSLIDDRLWGFQYVAIYSGDVEQAAADTVTVARQLQRTYGTAKQNGNKRTLWLSEIDEASVLEKFENRYLAHEGIDAVTGYWELSESVEDETRAYWEEYSQSEYWPSQFEGRSIELSFGLDLNAWNDPNTDRTYLCLDYETKYSFKQVTIYEEE